MFSFAKARLGTFFRTKSSLMLTVRRHLRKDDREHAELLKSFAGLKESTERGDVTQVNKKFSSADALHEHIQTDLTDDEKMAFMGQFRVLKPLADIVKWFGRVHSETEHLERGANAAFAKELRIFLKQEEESLRGILTLEQTSMKDEYNTLEREAKGEKGAWQNYALSVVNSKLELHKKLWQERGELGHVERDESELKELEQRFWQTLNHFDKKTPEELKKLIVEMQKETKQLKKDFEEMIHDFLFILKTMSMIWFEYEEQDEAKLKEFLFHLHESGFPVEDLQHLNELFTKSGKEIKSGTVELAAAFRRGARMALGEVGSV